MRPIDADEQLTVQPDVPDTNVGDTISRQAAIDAFNTNIDELVVSGKENADAVERYLNRVIDEIKQLPPIQPKRGRWQYNNKIGTFKIFTCDQCGWNSEAEFNFCPNCGAKMEVTK